MADPNQAVTGLAIIDTAVKIGLGAIITGLATYFVTKLNHDKELAKESIKRRRELLEQVASDMERFFNSFRMYYLVSLEVIQRHKINEGLPDGMFSEYEKREREVMLSTDNLGSSQSLLLLLGEIKANENLTNFAINSEEYMKATRGACTEKTIGELQKKYDTCFKNRNSFFSELNKAYEKNNF